jgi:hypothetical protein
MPHELDALSTLVSRKVHMLSSLDRSVTMALAAALTLLAASTPALAQSTGSATCATAPSITGTGAFNFNNQNAPEGTWDANACFMERSIWFRWTAPQTGTAVFSTCGQSDMDTTIAVYPDTCGSSKIACNDNAACGIGSTVTWSAVAGTQYLLRIGQPNGYWIGWYGTFTLAYDNPPQNNDTCQFATTIPGDGLYTYNTAAATSSPTDPASCDLIGKDVWFTYTPTATGTATFSTCGLSPFSGMRMAVYTGANACSSSTPYTDCTSQDIYCETGAVSLIFNVAAGQTYKVRIGSDRAQTTGSGQFRVTFTPQVTNDECQTATPISGTGWFPYTNASATGTPIPSDPSNYCDKDVWFRWTAQHTGPAYVTTCGRADINAFLAVFPDGCPTGEPLDANDDDPSCGTGARVDFRAVAGQSYIIRLGSVWGWTYTTSGQFFIDNKVQGPSGGETITVTMTGDLVDFEGFQQVADLPGPDGELSFREAVTAVNNTPGGQTINFAIDPMFWTYPMGPQGGRAQIIVDFYPFIITDHGTIIDGASQTAAFGDTDPSGPDVGFFGWQAENVAALYINADNCEVRNINQAAMCGYSMKVTGDNLRVVDSIFTGSLIGNIMLEGASNAVIGEPGHPNRLGGYNHGVSIDGGANNKVQNNVISGGFNGIIVGGGAANTLIGGPTDAERNIVLSVGRYVTEGFPTGTYINIGTSTGTIVQNNTVGLAVDGFNRQTGPGTTGIGLSNAVGAQVLNNTIAGIRVQGQNHYANQVFGTGLRLSGASDGAVLQGNAVGTDLFRVTQYPCLEGVFLGATYTSGPVPRFGGLEPGQGNLVAYSSLTGVQVGGSRSITISGNSIFENGLLGLDLRTDPLIYGVSLGVTANDSLDADTGANALQNFPTLSDANSDGAFILIAGTLHSNPSDTFRIEFFGNDACDPSGHGEGQRLLGSTDVSTDGNGNAPFAARLPLSTSPGSVVTATATRLSTGDTSEFSACATVGNGSTQLCGTADFNGDSDFGTDQDIEAFFACLAGNCCPTCYLGGADFNADGDFGTDQDIESFFRVLAGGPC